MMEDSENYDTSNFGDGGGGAGCDDTFDMTSSSKAARTPATATRPKRASTLSHSKSKTPSSAMRGHRASTVHSDLANLPAAQVLELLETLAKPACETKTDAWGGQDKFATTLLEALRLHTPAPPDAPEPDQLTALLPNYTKLFIKTLAVTTGCGRSGTQRTSLECYRLLFERCGSCPAMRDALDRNLETAYSALVHLVENNTSTFLHTGTCTCLRAAMRHVSASKLLQYLSKEVLSKAHDLNAKKSASLAMLLADAMDIATTGQFSGPAAKDYSCSPIAPPAINQVVYKDLVRCAVKYKRGLPQLHKHANTLLQGLASKGLANSVLTAEVRELSKTDRGVVAEFEAFYKEVMKKDLTTLTTSASGLQSSPANTRGNRAGYSTLTSPLPSSARAARGTRPVYAETMPSPSVLPSTVTARGAIVAPSPGLSTESFALPSSSGEEEYVTSGAGLLDTLTAANAGDDTATVVAASNWMYTYDDSCINNSDSIAADGDDDVAQKLNFDSEGQGSASGLTVDVGILDTTIGGSCIEANDISVDEEITFKPIGSGSSSTDDSMTINTPTFSSGEITTTAASAAAARGSQQLVYNYDRSSMVGIVPTSTRSSVASTRPSTASAGMFSPMARTTRASAASSIPQFSPAAVPRSAAAKRKFATEDLSAAAAAPILSPRSELRSLQVAVKRHKNALGAISSSSTPPVPSDLVPEIALARVTRLASGLHAKAMAEQADQHYWTEKRHTIRARRAASTSVSAAAMATKLANAANAMQQ